MVSSPLIRSLAAFLLLLMAATGIDGCANSGPASSNTGATTGTSVGGSTTGTSKPVAPAVGWSEYKLGGDFQTDGAAALSCANTAFCMAISPRGDVAIWNGRAWRLGPPVPTSDVTLTGGASDLDVSCASGSFCMALADSNGSITAPVAYWRWSGKNWSTGQIASPLVASVFPAIQCLSARFCMGYGGTWNGSSWETTDANSGDPTAPWDCRSTTWCLGLTTGGKTNIWDGKRWTQAGVAPSEFDEGNHASVSCASEVLCFAGSGGGGYLYEWDGATPWVRSTLPGQGGSTSVACASATFCATGLNGYQVSFWDGSVWSEPSSVGPAGGPDSLYLACPHAGYCVGVTQDAGVAFVYRKV
jgi:hypothetical protein